MLTKLNFTAKCFHLHTREIARQIGAVGWRGHGRANNPSHDVWFPGLWIHAQPDAAPCWPAMHATARDSFQWSRSNCHVTPFIDPCLTWLHGQLSAFITTSLSSSVLTHSVFPQCSKNAILQKERIQEWTWTISFLATLWWLLIYYNLSSIIYYLFIYNLLSSIIHTMILMADAWMTDVMLMHTVAQLHRVAGAWSRDTDKRCRLVLLWGIKHGCCCWCKHVAGFNQARLIISSGGWAERCSDERAACSRSDERCLGGFVSWPTLINGCKLLPCFRHHCRRRRRAGRISRSARNDKIDVDLALTFASRSFSPRLVIAGQETAPDGAVMCCLLWIIHRPHKPPATDRKWRIHRMVTCDTPAIQASGTRRFISSCRLAYMNKKLSYCWETVRRESMPRIAEMDVEMTT